VTERKFSSCRDVLSVFQFNRRQKKDERDETCALSLLCFLFLLFSLPHLLFSPP